MKMTDMTSKFGRFEELAREALTFRDILLRNRLRIRHQGFPLVPRSSKAGLQTDQALNGRSLTSAVQGQYRWIPSNKK